MLILFRLDVPGELAEFHLNQPINGDPDEPFSEENNSSSSEGHINEPLEELKEHFEDLDGNMGAEEVKEESDWQTIDSDELSEIFYTCKDRPSSPKCASFGIDELPILKLVPPTLISCSFGENEQLANSDVVIHKANPSTSAGLSTRSMYPVTLCEQAIDDKSSNKEAILPTFQAKF